MKSTRRTRLGTAARIAVVASGLLSPVVAIFGAQTGVTSAGKAWNRPALVVAAGPTVSPYGKAWN